MTGCSWDVAVRIGKGGETALRRRRGDGVRAASSARSLQRPRRATAASSGLTSPSSPSSGRSTRLLRSRAGTGKNPTDRGEHGWRWSLATDARGIPIAWTPAAADRHDSKLLEETLAILDLRGWELDMATAHLDLGFDHASVRALFRESGIDAVTPMRRGAERGARRPNSRVGRGERWPVERASFQLTSFGLLRRDADRTLVQRKAVLDPAALTLATKLVKWRKRPGPVHVCRALLRRWSSAMTAVAG